MQFHIDLLECATELPPEIHIVCVELENSDTYRAVRADGEHAAGGRILEIFNLATGGRERDAMNEQ